MLKQVLIVGDDGDGCNQLVDALFGTYEIRLAKCGSEALSILSGKNAARISAILLDLSRASTDGIAFLSTLSGTPGLRDLPVLVLADPLDHGAELRGLEYGAYDFVTMPFNPAILAFRLKNTIERSEYAAFSKYRYLAEYDAISGVYNRTKFYDAARRVLDANPETRFILARFDLDRFKAYNDLFGMEEGDKLLREMGRFFLRNLDPETNYGRLEADHFVFCLPEERFKAGRLISDFSVHFGSFQPNFVLSPRIGVFQITDPSLDVSRMCDRALMALRSIKSGSALRVAYYDDSMRKRILEEQALIGDMEEALRQEQYEVYLQPQYNHRTRQLVGAEALVRWNHPQKGMIPPNSFIPILEKNGFISRLDFFVWERVCQLLKRWHEEGMPVVSISVNLSAADIQMPNLCGALVDLTRKYCVDPRELRLEITETSYMENAERFLSVIGALREQGFWVEMDDFGKGYSSLNTLKNVPVDVLKLDLGFLRETESSGGRSGIILNAVMHMAHWLNLPVIAEGVETLRQADYLASIGCDLVQGYLYAHPLPIPEFEALLTRGETGDFIGDYALLSQIDVKELWNPDSEATTIFRSFVGPAGLFEQHDGRLEALRINQKLCDLFEIDYTTFRAHSANALDLFDEAQRAAILSMLEHAGMETEEASCQILFHAVKTSRAIRLLFRAQIIAISVDRKVFFIGCEDFTAQQRELEEQRWHEEQSRLLMENTGSLAFEYDPDTDTLLTFQSLSGKGLERSIKPQFLRNLPNDPALHPSSADQFAELVRRSIREPDSGESELLIDFNGSGFRWYRVSYTSLTDDFGRVCRVVGRTDDIQFEREHQTALAELDRTLRLAAEIDSVTGVYSLGSINVLVRNQLNTLKENERAYLLFFEAWDFSLALEALGHERSNGLLSKIAFQISSQTESGDLLGRIGQSAFAMLVRSKIREKALVAKAEGILQSIQLLPEVQSCGLCASAGIAAVTCSEPSFHHLLQRLDAALDKAKTLGKARCVFAAEAASIPPERTQTPSLFGTLQPLLLDQVFHLLFNSENIEAGINASIAVIGKLAQVSRVFVFELCGEHFISNTFEWCLADDASEQSLLRHEPAGSLRARDFRAFFLRDGMLIFQDAAELRNDLSSAVQSEGIVSLLEGALMEDGKCVGYIGYEEHRADHAFSQQQINMLTSVSRVISVFILKRRAMLREEAEKAYHAALYACVGLRAFVLDSGSCRMRICNRLIREYIGRDTTGEYCYRVLWNRDEPCANCPAMALDEGSEPGDCAGAPCCRLAFGPPYEGKRILTPVLAENATK
ncbi:MAG: EAL domain-containing protein [Clostridiaceae bacterium]